jgi:hypothetical protein
MTAISRLPGSIDAIVTLLQDGGLTVFDGPEGHDYTEDLVYIGYDGDENGRFKAANTDQSWAGTQGAYRRDEELDIICSVIALRGDRSLKLLRDAAYDLLGTVEALLRANPSLGFTPPYVAGVRPREFFYQPFNDGYQGRLVFTISIRTRV